MAQFNHPEFGGCGQWMRGGMTMVSDLFNHSLRYRVDCICNEIANEFVNHQITPFRVSFQLQSQNGVNSQLQVGGRIGSENSLFAPDPEVNWWAQELGVPNALGSQTPLCLFRRRSPTGSKNRRRRVDLRSQRSPDRRFFAAAEIGRSITFTSQYGTVNLSTLLVISRNDVTPPSAPVPAPQPTAFAAPVAVQGTG